MTTFTALDTTSTALDTTDTSTSDHDDHDVIDDGADDLLPPPKSANDEPDPNLAATG